jgi:hypothetical protein
MRYPPARAARALLALGLIGLACLAVPGAAQAQADAVGQWRLLTHTTPINPIHVAVLRTGRILIASGSENDPTHTTFRAAVYNPATGAFALQDIPWDLFCNGMSALPDGRVLITGGNLQYNPFRGLKTTTIFDPATERFIQVQDMARGRWYPSNAALPDGTTMTFSGWLHTAGVPNDAVEIYDVGTGWTPEFRAPFSPPLYPWLHLLPSGRVFFSGSRPDSALFDPVARTWTTNVARTVYGQDRRYGSSVLLPLRPQDSYRARVMIMGGNNPATATAEIIDLSAGTPRWQSLPPMSRARIEMNAVLLPTGKVLALGGSAVDNDASSASLDADLFDPDTQTWAPAGRNAVPRLYHSVALLLPDATVWVAGSNPFQGSWDNRLEIYSPPYLFTRNSSGQVVAAARPAISGAPARVGYDAGFQVQTASAADIDSVVLVRPGSATHAFDFEQRLIEMNFTRGSGVLNVTAPPNANVAPPGHYMLFIINGSGVPSVARFVQLSTNPGNQPPDATISNPSADVTITAGQSVTFAGTGTDADGSISRYSWVFPGGSPGASTVATPGAVQFATPGTYIVSLTVVDDDGVNDPSPPWRRITVLPSGFTASITSPPEGATVNGTQTVGMAVGGGGTAPFTYTLRVDSTQVFTQATSATSTSFTWNTATVPDGARTLTLTVTDSASRTATATRKVTVQNSGGLRVSLTSPTPGQTVSGVVWANVWVDGGTGPFNYRLSVGPTTIVTQSSSNRHVTLPWDTRTTSNGAQTLVATVSTATASGSASVTVNVQNAGGGPGPLAAAFTSPAAGATVSGTVSVGMSASGGTGPYTFTLRIDGAVALTQSGPATTATYSWDTRTFSNASHSLALTVSDGGGGSATASRTVTVDNASSGTLTLAVTSPTNGQTVSGTVWANVWMQQPFGTAPYTYTLTAAGAQVWSENSSNTHVTLPWVTTQTPDGPQTLTVAVRDAAGRTGATNVSVVVQNGGGGATLTAAISSPAEGATVSGSVTVTMAASGGTAPYTYTLRLDGGQVFTQSTSATSTTWTWNTAGASNGAHALGLTVADSASRTATATRNVTVSNGGSTGTLTLAVTSPTAGQTVSGTVWVNIWLQQPFGTAPYTYTLTAAGEEVWSQASSNTHVTLPWVTTETPDGPQTLTVSVRDAANRTGSTGVPVTVQNGGGGGPGPLTASIPSPAQGATVSGSTAVSMTAGGGTPPYTYTLRLDGGQVFTQTTSATSASWTWNTTTASNASHTLSLTVADAAAGTATATRTVTVANSAGGTLTLAVTSPKSGQTVSGTTWVNIWINAPYGTPPYTYLLTVNGETAWEESSSATHVTLPWITTETANGAERLTVTVIDAAARTGTAFVDVVIQNP